MGDYTLILTQVNADCKRYFYKNWKNILFLHKMDFTVDIVKKYMYKEIKLSLALKAILC